MKNERVNSNMIDESTEIARSWMTSDGHDENTDEPIDTRQSKGQQETEDGPPVIVFICIIVIVMTHHFLLC